MQPQTRSELLRHGALVVACSVLIATGLTLVGHARLDENLVYSLSIGLCSWLSIDLSRLWFSRRRAIPWPGGGRGLQGWLLVGAGSVFGYCVGMAVGSWYSGRPLHLTHFASPLMLSSPLVITLLASVALSFFFYSQGKARFLIASVAQAQRDAAEARLALLQSQLEPHMLFNTLANLRVLVASDPRRAQAMLDHLIDYLRATLGASRVTLHPLADEFARLGDYLELMAVRMGPRLAFTLDLPAALQAVPVPPLLLQPLVENAIRHGLEPVLAGGRITVRARLIDATADLPQRLELTVQDDGAGLPPGWTAPAAGTPTAEGGAFGLVQVRERLATLYGTHATIQLIAPSAGGTSATVVFPLKPQTPPPSQDLPPCQLDHPVR
ncbi:histidine kinase [Acidovorax sp. FG27]|uniref:sensor histidine kinase n=1 Tax=Acidovorax sp. FG27 TaxID=3133652 RepID=UPI0030E8F689